MALSNIFREPRREITESVIGVATCVLVAAAFYWVDDYFATMFMNSGRHHDAGDWWFAMLMGIPLAGGFGALSVGLLIATHEFGDVICDMAESRGMQLRPRNRPTAR